MMTAKFQCSSKTVILTGNFSRPPTYSENIAFFFFSPKRIVCFIHSKSLILRSRSYLEGVISKTQAKLSADHHGLHCPPAVTAHCAPNQRAIPVRQHLDTALIGVTAPV